jgi:protein TonB
LAVAQPDIGSSERLTFTLFLALVLHLVLILGIGFTALKNRTQPPTLEITLARHSSPEEPEEADFLAQSNQQASGTLEEKAQITTNEIAEFADTEINRVEPIPKIQATVVEVEKEKQVIVTTGKSDRVVADKPEKDKPKEDVIIRKDEKTDTDMSAKIASLQAKLDRQKQKFAKRPRVRTLTSVSTKSAIDAAYLYRWQEKVEMVGNINYPDEARRKKLYGNLRLLVTLVPNGAVLKVEVLKSSGHRTLDQAAIRIVRMSAPFPPFPKELKNEIDRLEIIRTWRFEKGDILSARN